MDPYQNQDDPAQENRIQEDPIRENFIQEDPAQTRRLLRRAFSRLGWAAFALMGVTQLLAAVFAVAVLFAAPQWMASPWYSWLLSYLPLYLAAFPIFWLMVRRMPSQRPGGSLEVSPGQVARLVLLCLGATYALNYVSLFINFLIGLAKGAPVINPLAEITGDPLSTFLFAGLVAPIMEEVIFRKILLDRLLPYGETFAVYGTAFLFALFHANLSQLLYAFVLGAIFALLTLRTGGIRLSALLHIIINNIGAFLLPYVLGLLPQSLSEGMAYAVTGGLVLVGAVLWRFMPKAGPAPAPQPLTPGEKRRAFLLNPGMLAYIILIVILIALVTMV